MRACSASYKVLNSLGNVLKEKREAESFLQQSSLDFVILRPGVFASKPQVRTSMMSSAPHCWLQLLNQIIRVVGSIKGVRDFQPD